MRNPTNSETAVSIIRARNGPLIIFQGFAKQALFVSQENILRFIRDPEQTALLVIPPMASLALNCYLTCTQVDSIDLKRDIALGDDFTLTVRSSEEKGIRFYSDGINLAGARSLRADSIGIVVTPQICASVDSSKLETTLSTFVEFPGSEDADYPNRFAHAPRFLGQMVAKVTGRKSQINCHEN